MQVDHAGEFQRFQRRDRRHQFHAVVGGELLAALQLLLAVAEGEHRAPATRPRIPGTGAVGIDGDALRLGHCDAYAAFTSPQSKSDVSDFDTSSSRTLVNPSSGR